MATLVIISAIPMGLVTLNIDTCVKRVLRARAWDGRAREVESNFQISGL